MSRFVLPVALFAAVAVTACSNDPAGPSIPDPLAGLIQASAHDSTGAAIPPGPATGTGQVSGTVLGPSEPGAGNDSLRTAPRVFGAVVTVYPVTSDAPLVLGDAVGTTITGVDGRFTLPVLPSGQYVVTIEPPSGSPYYGQWIHGMIHAGSGEHPWWIVLAKR